MAGMRPGLWLYRRPGPAAIAFDMPHMIWPMDVGGRAHTIHCMHAYVRGGASKVPCVDLAQPAWQLLRPGARPHAAARASASSSVLTDSFPYRLHACACTGCTRGRAFFGRRRALLGGCYTTASACNGDTCPPLQELWQQRWHAKRHLPLFSCAIHKQTPLLGMIRHLHL